MVEKWPVDAPASVKKKSKVDSEKDVVDATKEVYMPEWNIGAKDSLFTVQNSHADAVDLLQGIFFPQGQ